LRAWGENDIDIHIHIDKLSPLRLLKMATTQLLIRLPDELVRRFKRSVPVRQRSRFVERLLEQALPPADASDDDPLYQAALMVEQDQDLAAEMAEWEAATIDDGLGDGEVQTRDA
jgi:hypothetical protein